MAERFAARINFVHLRNVAKDPDGSFTESDHLGGDVDMVKLIGVLLREQRRRAAAGETAPLPMRPDHGHLMGFDGERRSNPGYSYIGRLRGLAELRGIMTALEAVAR
jgi:mannonate dehydratase